jgi:hypothetical protein
MLGAMKFPRPTRRWFQFSLRALLLFVTLCAIACSWLAVKLRAVKREEAAAAAIEKAGGSVLWNGNAPGPAWLRGVLGEHFFAHVLIVGLLEGAEVTDSTLEPLDAMNDLQRLDLEDANFTDAGLEHLQGLHELRELGLYGTNLTDAGLEKIAALKELERLTLEGTQFTDAGLGKLASSAHEAAQRGRFTDDAGHGRRREETPAGTAELQNNCRAPATALVAPTATEEHRGG